MRRVAQKSNALIAKKAILLVAQKTARLVAYGIKYWLQAFLDYKDRVETDSGAVEDDEATNDLFKYHEDEGLDANLVLHIHSDAGLKTRTSGSDEFVEKAYDMSGEENDAAQATTDNQPKLVSDGMEFDGDTDRIIASDHASLQITGSMTIISWIKYYGSESLGDFIVGKMGLSGERGYAISTREVGEFFRFFIASNSTTLHSVSYPLVAGDINTYVMITAVYDAAGQTMKIYKNSETPVENDDGIPASQYSNNGLGVAIGDRSSDRLRTFPGIINDIRIYNTALSAAQISDIFDETKGKYGIT